MRLIIDIPEVPKNDHQRWVMANGEKYEHKQGEWIPIDIGEWVFRCSLCHDVSTFESKFCGNCGARMRGDEK